MSALVYLRPFEARDNGPLHRWQNDPDLYKSLLGEPQFPGRETVERWIDAKRTAANELNLAICVAADDRYIGNAYLREIDTAARCAELHIFIGNRGERSRGYGEAAVRQLVERAFGELGLERVLLRVLADNGAAIRVYEKCGFSVDERLAGHARKDGVLKDVLVMSVRRPTRT